MAKVFIVNKGFHDYMAARSYGELVAVTIGNVNLKSTDRLEAKVQHALRNAEPTDILLLGGAAIINTFAQLYMINKHGFVNVLCHDPGSGEYILRKQLSGAPREVQVEDGVILCPNCHRVIAEAQPGIVAYATEICELCVAEKEEEMEEVRA